MNNIVEDIDTLLSNNYLLYDNFPHPEGTQLEFKKTFHTNQLEKYRQTICALLNTNGGHIIYGISNDCSITGCNIKQTEIDNILLFVDSLYEILKKSDGNHIEQNTLKVRIDEIAKNIYIIIISCYREGKYIYQFLSGESWTRINASNRKCNLSKLHSIQDIITIKSKLETHFNIKLNHTVIEIANIMNKKNNIEQEINKKDIVKTNYYSFLGTITLLIITIGLSIDKYHTINLLR
jgi:predicted HTH transcriptional regulator